MTFKRSKLVNIFAAGALLFTLAACDTPEEKAAAYIENGKEHYKEGELIKALIEYKNALQIDDKLIEGWLGIAEIEEKRKKWDQVRGALRRTLDINPDHLDANLRLGRLMLLGSNLERAIGYSNKAFELAPDNIDAQTLQAAVLYKLGDSEGAAKYAQQALVKEPGNLDALIVMAAERLGSGKGLEAIEYLDKGIAAHKDNTSLSLIKIQALTTMEQLDEAEAVFKRLVELNAEDVTLRNALVGFLVKLQKYDEAGAELRKIAELKPDDVEANMRLVQFVNNTQGSDAAMTELNKLIQTRKANESYQFALIDLLYAADKKEEAFKVLSGLELAAQNPVVKNNAKIRRAELLIASGENEKAMEIVTTILTEDARNGRALSIRGAHKIKTGDLDGAVIDLRAILKDDPNSSRALMLLGNAHEQLKAFDLADDRYGLAFKASNFSDGIGMYYTQFLLRRGLTKRAESTLLKVIENNRTNLNTMKLLADIRLSLGDWSGAQEIVELMKKRGVGESDTLQIQGRIFAGRNMVEQSIQAFKAVHSETPEALQPIISLVQTYISDGQVDKADEFIDSVLVANDQNFYAHLLKGRIALIKEDKGAAEVSYKQAISVQKDNPVGYSNLATFYLTEDRYNESITLAEEGLTIASKDIRLYLVKANAQQLMGNIDAAIATYENVLTFDNENLVVSNNLASLLIDKNDPTLLPKAAELSEVLKGSRVAFFRDTVAMVQLRQGNVDIALKTFKDLNRQTPDTPVFKLHLAEAMIQAGDTAGAKTQLLEIQTLTEGTEFEYQDQVEKLLQSLG